MKGAGWTQALCQLLHFYTVGFTSAALDLYFVPIGVGDGGGAGLYLTGYARSDAICVDSRRRPNRPFPGKHTPLIVVLAPL